MTISPEQVVEAFGLSADTAIYASQGLNLGLGMLQALAILFVGWLISKWAYRFAVNQIQKRQLDPALGKFLASMLQWTIIGAAAIASLGAVGIETTSVVAIFASAGIAVGLALQGSLSNFAAGVMILVFRPFTIGDMISAGGETGVVHEIGMFATTMHTADGLTIIVPNSAITGGTITNITTKGTRRADVPVGVAYGEDPAKIMKILADAAASASTTNADPAPAVAFVGLGASSIDFMVMAWCDSADYLAALHQIREACYNALNREGVEIPYDQVVVHKAEAS